MSPPRSQGKHHQLMVSRWASLDLQGLLGCRVEVEAVPL
jgi:hypothetical protein